MHPHIQTHAHTYIYAPTVLLFKNDVTTYEVFVKDAVEVRDGATIQYCFSVSGSEDFIATLVWLDAPSSPDATVTLVQDLDMSVALANGTFYLGNERQFTTEAATVKVCVSVCMCVCVYIYIYIYIYMCVCVFMNG